MNWDRRQITDSFTHMYFSLWFLYSRIIRDIPPRVPPRCVLLAFTHLILFYLFQKGSGCRSGSSRKYLGSCVVTISDAGISGQWFIHYYSHIALE